MVAYSESDLTVLLLSNRNVKTEKKAQVLHQQEHSKVGFTACQVIPFERIP